MKFYEKLIILIVLFLGVTIGTAAIIGVYHNTTKKNDAKNNQGTSIILESIPFYDYYN